MNENKNSLKEQTGFRIFIYLISLLLCVMVGSVITFLMNGDINQLRIGQGISSVLIFVAPPLILYAVTRPQPFRQLGLRTPNSFWLLLIGMVLMFVSLPLTNLLTSWNEQMHFGFEALEKWLSQLEESAGDLTEQMLQADNIGGLLLNLLVIALIPAIGEELTFRGVLQQALVKGTKNAHVGILLSAAIFSFIHFQFYGFLPRMFLGILLGYMFYYSGSLWTSILMHFVNNGTAVVIAYLDYKGLINVEMETFGSTNSVPLIIASLLVTVGLIVMSSKIKYKYGRK